MRMDMVIQMLAHQIVVNGYGDSDASSSGSREGKIKVANMLPLHAKIGAKNGKRCFILDEDLLLLHLKVIYVGCLKVDIDASEQDAVSKKPTDNFNYAISSGSCERKIIVANMLALHAKRDAENGKWFFILDLLLLHLKVIYVGCLKVDIDASEQDAVSKKPWDNFNCAVLCQARSVKEKGGTAWHSMPS
ncbi:hypothetical protein Dsin_015316 [Dipteronia sinensis]|uniref:Uncharacterized protein n=1 Tax=Dipteronia sinensis TaxID=43782 RepID=A0AAE0ACC3_9ROSI|nr:hypothetical protein Dsin_015316 [Dipteronia sinensis]